MSTTATPDRIMQLEERLRPLSIQLAKHRLYSSLQTIQDLQLFMESHVYAVWDFMSLLKALQRGLTSVDVPWVPSATPESRRLINEIVLGEESDVYCGEAMSHFEIYLLAMQSCGARTSSIEEMISQLRGGADLQHALSICGAPAAAEAFVRDTFAYISTGDLHTIAAAFTFGREDLIPEIFKSFVRSLDHSLSGQLEPFLWYLERHIEVDGEEHGPMALRMVSNLCGEDEQKWGEAEIAAVSALQSRLRLWDGIADAIAAR